MRRFLNADILTGDISNAITLNRFAYANGNPVSNIDPFGLAAERGMRQDANYIVMRGLEDLYWVSYYYYDFVTVDKKRVQFANEAVMRFIAYMKRGILK